jgi:hypothetical protein
MEPIACRLEPSVKPARARTIAALGDQLTAVDVRGRTASLEFAPDAADGVAEFVRAESACCPFFGFEQAESAAGVRLDVAVPEDGEWALRGLVAGFVASWEALV